MCTVSWLRDASGYDLFFNRDERRSRKAAGPPREWSAGTARAIAPRDGEAGGSWIAVNQHGLTVALLNGYLSADAAAAPASGTWTSRGLLVMRLAACRDVGDVGARLDATDLASFRSFHLLALDRERTLLAGWAGGALSRTPEGRIAAPLISSSFRYDAVAESRRALWTRLQAGGDSLDAAVAFHRAHEPERGAFSPCMHRDDARTVSFTHVRVDRERAIMHYAPDAPCRCWPPEISTEIALARAPGGSPGRSSTSR